MGIPLQFMPRMCNLCLVYLCNVLIHPERLLWSGYQILMPL